jgi:hypothetical protein
MDKSYSPDTKDIHLCKWNFVAIFILVIIQLDAQNLFNNKLYNFMPLHISSTMCSSSGGHNCIIQPLVSLHLQVAVPCTGQGINQFEWVGHNHNWFWLIVFTTEIYTKFKGKAVVFKNKRRRRLRGQTRFLHNTTTTPTTITLLIPLRSPPSCTQRLQRFVTLFVPWTLWESAEMYGPILQKY